MFELVLLDYLPTDWVAALLLSMNAQDEPADRQAKAAKAAKYRESYCS